MCRHVDIGRTYTKTGVKFNGGVVDTGEQFFCGVVDNGDKF
jgi:hypothetical protein